jgi:hypothetical protein
MQTLIPNRLVTWAQEKPLGLVFRSYAYKDGDDVVWIDPVEPTPEELPLVEALGRPTHVVLTFGDHDRDAKAIAKRYRAELWVPGVEGGDHFLPDADRRYTEASTMPAGLHALHLAGVGHGEHALYGHAEGRRFAFVGESVLHIDHLPWPLKILFRQPKGELQHKAFYNGGDGETARRETKRLLSLELDVLLPAHGSPIMADAAGKLQESLSAW